MLLMYTHGGRLNFEQAEDAGPNTVFGSDAVVARYTGSGLSIRDMPIAASVRWRRSRGSAAPCGL